MISLITPGVIVGAGVADGRIKPLSSSSTPGAGVALGGLGVSVAVALGELVGIGALVGELELQEMSTNVSNMATDTIRK